MSLFGLTVALWVGLTLFESAFLGMSLGAERLVTFLLLVLPSSIGAGLALWSLVRREGRTGLALAALILNTLFALFQLAVILFAG